MHFVHKKRKTLIFCSSKSKKCATQPARAANAFGMAICVRYRGPKLGKSSRKKKKKRKRTRKKNEKGAQKTTNPESLKGARVHAKKKKELRLAFRA